MLSVNAFAETPSRRSSNLVLDCLARDPADRQRKPSRRWRTCCPASLAPFRGRESKLVNGGVDLVFHGHQHMYARVRAPGRHRYFVTGGGSKKPLQLKNNDNSYPREDNGKFNHFVYSRVSEECLE